MATVTAGQSAIVTIPAGSALTVTTTGEGRVELIAGAAGAGYTSWRVTPDRPLALPQFSTAGQVRLVGISGTTSDSARMPEVLTPAEVALTRSLVSGAWNQVPRRVLAFGTSITNYWGDTGASASQRTINGGSYLFWLLASLRGAISPANVINRGVSGNTTTQMLARFAADVVGQSFDLAIFEPGPNDYAASFSAATVQANISAIVNNFLALARPLILLVPNSAESWTSAQFAVWQEVRAWMYATYNGQTPLVRLVDASALLADPLTGLPLSVMYRPTSVEAVRIHPSMSGAQVMGRALAETLPWARAYERQITPGARDHYELLLNSRLQGNNASTARNFYAGAGVTVTGGPDSAAVAITRGTFTGVTIAPVTADGASISAPAGGTRLTINTAGSDRSAVTLRVGSNDNSIGGTQYGRHDQAWAATTAQTVGDHRPLTASPDGYLTCIVAGTTGGTAPVAPAAYGMTVTDGTVTWLWQKLPAPGDVVVAEVEYEIESVSGGVALKAAAQVCRTAGSEMFAYGVAGQFDESATITDGLPNVWMPRRGVLTSLPLTLTALGFAVRHAWVNVIAVLPNGGSATIRIDRVSLRRVA